MTWKNLLTMVAFGGLLLVPPAGATTLHGLDDAAVRRAEAALPQATTLPVNDPLQLAADREPHREPRGMLADTVALPSVLALETEAPRPIPLPAGLPLLLLSLGLFYLMYRLRTQ
ncbi:MAG: hypothetical protein AAFV49_08380 [Pseudomonadota bacterium]